MAAKSAATPASRPALRYGSDIAAQLLRDLGIEYVAMNPGASFRGLHDSIVNFDAADTPRGNPEVIDCTQEGVAVAVAHGYAKASGKPMAVVVHNVVGLQAASMAIFNAWCDQVPILVLGGTGPTAADKRRPWIEWVHTALVQGNIVRDYVKWDDQPSSHEAVVESILRAARLASSEPQGPVYVCLDAGLQEEALEDPPVIPDPSRLATPPASPAADEASLSAVASALRTAQFPVIVAGRVGRSPEAFEALSALSDAWGIALIDTYDRLNAPTDHPMNLSDDVFGALERADVCLALDVKDLLGPLSRRDGARRTITPAIGPETQVFTIGLGEYAARGWIADYQALYPADLNILADTRHALPALARLLGAPSAAAATRRDEIAAWHTRLRQRAESELVGHDDERPVALSTLASTLRDALGGEDFMLSTGNRLRGWVPRIFDLHHPHQFLGGDGGAGLGAGAGFTIGACLAHRRSGTIVVALQPDGDFMHTPGGLWTLAHHDLPALVVMHDNRSYYNSEDHQYQIAGVRGRDEKRAGIGTVIDSPAIDYAVLAKSMGVEGIGPIDDPKALPDAFGRALRIIKEEHRPVLVDVVTQAR